jgi:hypothetical protein
MTTVADLAGNNPVAVDPTVRRTDKVSSVEWRGASQALSIGATNIQSTVFGKRTRFVRIAPDGDIYYAISENPDATVAAQRKYLVADGVEPVPVRPGERIAVTQVGASTGTCTITEDAA